MVQRYRDRVRAIAYMLDSFSVLADDPDEVLDVYFRQCSLQVTSADLARMGATLARGAGATEYWRVLTAVDARGNSVRGVLLCRSLSERLSLHFPTVAREPRSTIRAIYEPVDRVRVYELHGDLMFAGAEQVARIVDREVDDFDVTVMDVTGIDIINDTARELLAGLSAALPRPVTKGSSSLPTGS